MIIMKENERKCPECNSIIRYQSVKSKKYAEKEQTKCPKCSRIQHDKRNVDKNRIKMEKMYLKFDEKQNQEIINIFNSNSSNWKKFRKEVQPLFKKLRKEKINSDVYRMCPVCDRPIKYSCKYFKNCAEKIGSQCKSCAKTGDKNSFYGKKHSTETIKKTLKTLEISPAWKKHLDNIHSDEYKKHFKENFSGENNPRFGLGSLKEIWTRKYGEKIAHEKDLIWRKKMSEKSSGKGNPMYGKPSPLGSGNGWSGWYKGWYFRSLHELSYMVNIIERFVFRWESGELKKYKIEYIDWDGKKRNYFPDFVLNNKYMIECKPKRLHNSVSVQCKAEAAKEFCKQNNLIFKLTDPHKISEEKMIELYMSGDIVFIERYEKKFIERQDKIKKDNEKLDC